MDQPPPYNQQDQKYPAHQYPIQQPYANNPSYQQAYAQPNIPYNPQVVVTQPPVVILNGGCPSCRVGMLVDDYGCLAIFLAIFFFPIGVLCCLALREKRCTNCGRSF